LLQGWHLSDSQNQKTCCFYTAKKLHREDFTHRSLYTERDLHRAAFRQTLLPTDAFTYRSFYTEKPFLKKPYHMKPLHRAALHTDAFSQKEFLHTGTLTRRCPSFCTHTHTRAPYKKKLLDTETFTAFSQESFYTEAFAQRCLYKQKLDHAEAFTHRSLETEQLLHREDFAQLHREAFSQTSVCGKEL